MSIIGVIEAVGIVVVGVMGVALKAVSVLMIAAAALLFYLTKFSGWNALSVILTAAGMFWLPELVGILLGGLVLLQRKIADSLLC